VDFAPRRFVPVDAAIDRKLAAIAAYRSQTTKCSYLADDLLRATARYWGRFVESDHAEPLEIVRQQVMTRSNSESTQRTIDFKEVDGDVLSSS
jgi:LmbE family N-acetylglucosaminyl deacetylase